LQGESWDRRCHHHPANRNGAVTHSCIISLGIDYLVYVYTNSRLLAEGKEKDEKKWYADNVDSEDLDSMPEEEFKDHGDLDSDGMDDGNLGVRGSYGGTNRSTYAPRRDYALDLEDKYRFPRGGK
jgi:hypothetical protein